MITSTTAGRHACPTPSRQLLSHITWLLLALLPAPAMAAAPHTGETVRLQGDISEDVYAAGGSVEVQANIAGDLVVAGGRVSVSDRVGADMTAAGGTVAIDAAIGDDLRLAGGDITLRGAVGGDAFVAGGNITLSPGAKIDGRAWLAGGRLDLAGEIGQELKAAGGQIIIGGVVNGDARLTARSIRLLDGAVVRGNLIYNSPQAAEIADGAQVQGSVQYEPLETPAAGAAVAAAAAGIGLITLMTLFITGAALLLLCPAFATRAIGILRGEPWKCLGLGLAVFAATPVVIVILFALVIGWLPALVLIALYLLLLLAGFLGGVFGVGDILFRLGRRASVTRTRRLVSFAVGLLVVLLLGLIPLLGALWLFVLMLLGIGALLLGLQRAAAQP